MSFDVSGHFDGEDITKARDEGIMKRIKENGEGFDHPNVFIMFLRFVTPLTYSPINLRLFFLSGRRHCYNRYQGNTRQQGVL